jgi:hypothetical protein
MLKRNYTRGNVKKKVENHWFRDFEEISLWYECLSIITVHLWSKITGT